MRKLLVVAPICMALSAGGVLAGNPMAGKTRAAICAGCHGQDGISAVPNYPNLRGQKEQYLRKALRDYRDGNRNDPVMSPMAKPLTDADIDNLAAYYSRLK